jgi:energy-coupling factor transporter ATP-binding protein EcfA2
MAVLLEVKNFQSIEYASIEIEGLTVITGTNNAGKSALVRAFHAAVSNAPAGNRVRSGADFSEVSLIFPENKTLLWKKGSGINEYILNGHSYENVGRGTFEEVADFGVVPIECGKKLFWPQIARQQDHVAFVLDESGSTIAEAVVSDLEKVTKLNSALSLVEKDKRAVRAERKTRQKDIEESISKLQTWEPVREEILKIKSFREEIESLKSLRREILDLQQIQDQYKLLQEERERLKFLTFIDFPEISNLRLEDLSVLAQFWMSWETNWKRNEEMRTLKDFSFPEIYWDIEEVLNLQRSQNILLSLEKELSELDFFFIDSELRELEIEIEEISKKSCPTCGKI